jgi:PAS domain S-box-containing protein
VHLPPTLADWTFAGVVRDVSEQARRHRRLEEEATRSASVLAAVPDAMLVVDEFGLVVRSSQRAGRLFGYTDLEMIGLEVEQLMPESMRTKHVAQRELYADAPRTRTFGSHSTIRARRADGRSSPPTSRSARWSRTRACSSWPRSARRGRRPGPQGPIGTSGSAAIWRQ